LFFILVARVGIGNKRENWLEKDKRRRWAEATTEATTEATAEIGE